MSEVRDGEVRVDLTEAADAALRFIGVIRTPWSDRKECPRQGRIDGPECRVEIFDPWVPALAGLDAFASIELFYWLDRSRRDLVVQVPRHSGQPSGTFALRSPVRPNPIGLSLVKLERIEGNVLVVRGLDCLDGTPLVDIKPDRCDFSAKD